jgi:hypothetical protein
MELSRIAACTIAPEVTGSKASAVPLASKWSRSMERLTVPGVELNTVIPSLLPLAIVSSTKILPGALIRMPEGAPEALNPLTTEVSMWSVPPLLNTMPLPLLPWLLLQFFNEASNERPA